MREKILKIAKEQDFILDNEFYDIEHLLSRNLFYYEEHVLEENLDFYSYFIIGGIDECTFSFNEFNNSDYFNINELDEFKEYLLSKRNRNLGLLLDDIYQTILEDSISNKEFVSKHYDLFLNVDFIGIAKNIKQTDSLFLNKFLKILDFISDIIDEYGYLNYSEIDEDYDCVNIFEIDEDYYTNRNRPFLLFIKEDFLKIFDILFKNKLIENFYYIEKFASTNNIEFILNNNKLYKIEGFESLIIELFLNNSFEKKEYILNFDFSPIFLENFLNLGYEIFYKFYDDFLIEDELINVLLKYRPIEDLLGFNFSRFLINNKHIEKQISDILFSDVSKYFENRNFIYLFNSKFIYYYVYERDFFDFVLNKMYFKNIYACIDFNNFIFLFNDDYFDLNSINNLSRSMIKSNVNISSQIDFSGVLPQEIIALEINFNWNLIFKNSTFNYNEDFIIDNFNYLSNLDYNIEIKNLKCNIFTIEKYLLPEKIYWFDDELYYQNRYEEFVINYEKDIVEDYISNKIYISESENLIDNLKCYINKSIVYDEYDGYNFEEIDCKDYELLDFTLKYIRLVNKFNQKDILKISRFLILDPEYYQTRFFRSGYYTDILFEDFTKDDIKKMYELGYLNDLRLLKNIHIKNLILDY